MLVTCRVIGGGCLYASMVEECSAGCAGCGVQDSSCGVRGVTVQCCRCAHTRRVSPLTCLAICFLVLTYNLLGGFLFLALEGASTNPETAVAASKPNLPPTDIRARTVERLWSITEDLNILYKENWTKLAAKELLDFQKVLMKSALGVPGHDAVEQDYHWTFSASFLYALTLITTIGHGNVTPKSAAGKLVAIAYACVGIPITMLYLATIGEALARRVRSLYSRVCPPKRHPLFKPPTGSEDRRTPFDAAINLEALPPILHWTCRDHTRVPVALSILLIALYVALGSAVFKMTEKWTLVDGCFFSFSSLATIGFGNLRPGLNAGKISAKAEDIAVGVCCVYILVGIVYIAMCFNLIQEDLGSALRGIAGLCSRGSVHSTHAHIECVREKAPAAAS